MNVLIKLLRELKDTVVSIEEEEHSDAVLYGILMRGSSCDVYAFDHKSSSNITHLHHDQNVQSFSYLLQFINFIK